jgi:hypothetical protein
MYTMLKIILLGSLSFFSPILLAEDRPPQFVLISFDGSKSHNFWQESLNLAKQTNSNFSYFISGVYFLKSSDRNLYQGPHHKTGASDIGFGNNDPSDIQGRTQYVWNALEQKNDIGSHVNGHFDGSKWSYDDWASEFKQFHRFVEEVFSLNPDVQNKINGNWRDTLHQAIKGFRAPLLAVNGNMQQVLKDFNYQYDASQIAKSVWPNKMKTGVWNLGLTYIQLAGSGKSTIAMDYNVFYGQCNGKFGAQNSSECAVISPDLLAQYEKQTYQSYINAFVKSYYGNRAPISIGHHFSLWNKGIYWKALQKTVYAICTQPEVKCITHKDMVSWLEDYTKSKGPEALSVLTAGQFDKSNIPGIVAEKFKNEMKSFQQTSLNYQQSFSNETQKIMQGGDMPAAHMQEEINDVDLQSLRVDPRNL